MRSKLLLFPFLFALSSTSVLENQLECKFNEDTWDTFGDVYSCDVVNINDLDRFPQVNQIKGIHEPGKSNNDVDGIYFTKGSMKRIPNNLAEHFPNLKAIAIDYTGLNEVDFEALKDLKNLELVYFANSNISKLESGVFDGNKKLKSVILNDNPIETIHPSVFNNHRLVSLHLKSHQCRSIPRSAAGSRSEIRELLESIKFGGCLDGDFLTDFIIDLTKQIETLTNENEKLSKEIVSCEIEKVEQAGKIIFLEVDNRNLQHKLESVEDNLTYCQSKYGDFKETFEVLKEAFENYTSSEYPIKKYERLISSLKEELEVTYSVIDKCEKIKTPKSCECPPLPPQILGDADLEKKYKELVDDFNNLTASLNDCHNDLTNEKDKTLNCEIDKSRSDVETMECKVQVDDCREMEADHWEKFKTCYNDRTKCNEDKSELTQENKQLKFVIANHDRNMDAALRQRQLCEQRYNELWESCVRGRAVVSSQDPQCDTNSTVAIPPWEISSQCEELTKYLQEKLDVCELRLTELNSFIGSIEGVFQQQQEDFGHGLPPPDFTKCNKDELVTVSTTIEGSGDVDGIILFE